MELLKKIIFNFVVFAADGDLKLDSAFKPILTDVVGISTAVAALSLAVCVFRYMTAEDGSGIAAAKKDATTVVIAWIVLNSIGALILAILDLISGISI